MTGNFFVSQANSATVMVQSLCFTSTIPGSRTVTQLGLMHEIMGKVSLKFIFVDTARPQLVPGPHI